MKNKIIIAVTLAVLLLLTIANTMVDAKPAGGGGKPSGSVFTYLCTDGDNQPEYAYVVIKGSGICYDDAGIVHRVKTIDVLYYAINSKGVLDSTPCGMERWNSYQKVILDTFDPWDYTFPS